MKSLRELYRVGNGPSSSHTMGPVNAAKAFLHRNSSAERIEVVLYGSLAATGKGHLTDVALKDFLRDYNPEIIWEPGTFLLQHPNGMRFKSYDPVDNLMEEWLVFSTGGGAIDDFTSPPGSGNLYSIFSMNEALAQSVSSGLPLWQQVMDAEGDGFEQYLEFIWDVMKKSIKRGLEKEGALPGGLNLPRKASSYYMKSVKSTGPLDRLSVIFSYALAVSEENASAGEIVTAPTCGSCGVLPAVLYLLQKQFKLSDSKIYHALATAGMIGNIVKHNASIAGAEVGCQGEVGTACAMAAGAAAQILGGTPRQIEYAAEMGMEHHLGLTCDPIMGLVQIPCIERNAFGSARALNCASYALLSDGEHKISFDQVVETMYRTGKDLMSSYKETGTGGLAAVSAGGRV
jgi:L-serine dehydratase